jgi:hypothetical protein
MWAVKGEITFFISDVTRNNSSNKEIEGMVWERYRCSVWAEAIDAVRFVIHTSQRKIVVDDPKGRSAVKWVEDINMVYVLLN